MNRFKNWQLKMLWATVGFKETIFITKYLDELDTISDLGEATWPKLSTFGYLNQSNKRAWRDDTGQ
jgi:hypothetical protein